MEEYVPTKILSRIRNYRPFAGTEAASSTTPSGGSGGSSARPRRSSASSKVNLTILASNTTGLIASVEEMLLLHKLIVEDLLASVSSSGASRPVSMEIRKNMKQIVVLKNVSVGYIESMSGSVTSAAKKVAEMELLVSDLKAKNERLEADMAIIRSDAAEAKKSSEGVKAFLQNLQTASKVLNNGGKIAIFAILLKPFNSFLRRPWFAQEGRTFKTSDR